MDRTVKISIKKVFFSIGSIVTVLFILSFISSTQIVPQQYAATCSGYTFAYNECERGNVTACNPNGTSTKGKVIAVYKNSQGAYCCGTTVSTCNVATGKANAQVGDKCGVNGANRCYNTTSGHTGCSAQGAGVCAPNLYCCVNGTTTTSNTTAKNVTTFTSTPTPTPTPTNHSTVAASIILASSSSVQGDATQRHVLAAQAIIATDVVDYNNDTKEFSNPKFVITNIPAGQYQVMLHVNGYLNKQLANTANNVFTITQGQTSFNVPPTILTAGDVAPLPAGDNVIDIQDFNEVIGCLNMNATSAPTNTCINPQEADINKDGVIDSKDLSLIQSEFGQQGSIFVTSQQAVDCVADPACSNNTKSVQICPLKCIQQ